jgi:hypothetical protein
MCSLGLVKVALDPEKENGNEMASSPDPV